LRKGQRDICIVATVLIVFLVLALTAVTTAKPPLREDGIKSDHFSVPKYLEMQNLSIGYAVSAEVRGDQLEVQSWPPVEKRGITPSITSEADSPLGGPGIALGSGYLNLAGNFSTLWHQSTTANTTNADLIFDIDGDTNPEVMVVTTTYDPGTDIETKKLIIKKGTNGTHLWEEVVSAQGRGNCNIFVDWFLDLDGDGLDDAFVVVTERNASTGEQAKELIAKRGYDGTNLWNQTVYGTECGIAAEWVLNLDEDALDEVIVYVRSYDAATDIETRKVIAKKGNTGAFLWEQTVTASGYQNCSIWVEWFTDFDGDGLDDGLLRQREYNASEGTESTTIQARRGKDGATLWIETLRETEIFMVLYLVGDLDDDDLDDVLVQEWTYNDSTDLTTAQLIAKKGLDGTHLWNQSVEASGYDNCAIWLDGIADLNGDDIPDVLISESNYSESMDTSTSKVVAKHGLNGTHFWEQSVDATGRSTYLTFVLWIDLDGDDLDDVIVFEQVLNESMNTETCKMIAKRGFDGTQFWEQMVTGTESDIWTDLADDLDGDNRPDVIVSKWRYNESTDSESAEVIATRGFDGNPLWDQIVTGTESDIWTDLVNDLDGDNLFDVIVSKWSYSQSTDLETIEVIAKKGINGTHLWEQSLDDTNCNAGIPFTFDFDGDGLDDVLVYEWSYNESLNLNTMNLIAKKGINGTHLWEQSVNASGYRTTEIWAGFPSDIDGDRLGDLLVIEVAVNLSSQTVTFNVVAKKGTNGTHLWEQSVSGRDISLWIGSGFDLNGDMLQDFIIGRGSYTESTNTTSVILTAKRGYDGMHFWEQSVHGSVWESCDIWVEALADLDGDGLADVVVIERAFNEVANSTLERLITKRGYDGMHLFEAVSDEPIWTPGWWEAYNLDGLGLNDLLFGISTEMYAVTYHAVSPNLFDTGASSHPYPSIGGRHNGTITPLNDTVLHTLYTYACPGTGGHSRYVRIWGNGVEVNATWEGYAGDWDTISFHEPLITLVANMTYNYTIVTGSYPQIIHEKEFKATGGTITCHRFESANGRVYDQGIPAIRIE
jgi:hypothetical protein